MANAGSLNILLTASTAKLASDLKRGSKHVDSFSARVGQQMQKIGPIIAGVFAGLSAGAAVRSLQQTAEEIDAIGKAALSLGVSTEAMSGLRYAARLSGVESNELSAAMSRLLNVTGEAANGSKAAQAALAGLGLTAAQLQRLTPDQMLGRVADRVMAIPDPARRAAAMIDIFGRSGTQLIPMLAQGSAGLERMRTDAEALGLTFSALDFQNIEKMNDSVTRLGQAWEGLQRRMAARLAPDIGAGLDIVNDFITPDGAREQAMQNALERAKREYEQSIAETAGAEDIASRTAAIENQIAAMEKLMKVQAEVLRAQTVDAPLTVERMLRGDFETSKPAMTEKQIANEQRFLNLRKEALKVEAAANRELIARTNNTGSEGVFLTFLPSAQDVAKHMAEVQRQVEAEASALQRAAERVFAGTRTPAERYAEDMRELNKLLEAGAINAETFGRAERAAAEVLQRATERTMGELDRGEPTQRGQFETLSKAIDVKALGAAFGDMGQNIERKQLAALEDAVDLLTSIARGGGLA